MGSIIKTTREWALITACLFLIVIQVFPSLTDGLFPIIDPIGSNMTNMPVGKKVYACGDMVNGFFQFQKQRKAAGYIKWKLVPNSPNAVAYNYKPRPVAAPPGIISHWAEIEPLPVNCAPGEYHFEGSINYPLLFGSVSYPLRTVCFEVGVK